MGQSLSRPLRLTWVLVGDSLAGGTKSNRLIAEAMSRRGHEVRMLVPTESPKQGDLVGRLKHRIFGRPTALRSAPSATHLSTASIPIERVEGTRIRESDVPASDFIFFSWWEVGESVYAWSGEKGIPIHFVRGHELHGGDPDRVRRVYKHPGPRLAISNWLVRMLQEDYGHPDVTLVTNGIDRSQFNALPRSKRNRPSVGFLYGKQPLKGADTASLACRIAQKSLPELNVFSFGSAPWRESLEPPSNLRFELRPPQSRLAEIYRDCDCWLVPSTTEGLGMPGLEAAACRCPLVVTACGGPEDYCEENVNGFVVPVGDAESMAAAILKTVSARPHHWTKLSDASHRISQRFDWDRSAEVLEATLMRLRG